MNANNSDWYVRVAPDEVYWDICQEKAGFQVSFARINKGSLEFQQKLMPLRDEMEKSIAGLVGEKFKARSVNFQMPDFIDIILNAGDARYPLGGVLGESLPNWGKVATEGRGRTVVMTNLYTDPDSKQLSRERARLVLAPDSLAYFPDNPRPQLIDTILHEAAHNLGPHSDFKIDGKGPSQIFGGQLASTLEELKAQTAALYFTALLKEKGIITAEVAKQIYTDAMVWACNKISLGMFEASGSPKTYSQLAAVQVGFLVDEGAPEWTESTDQATKKPIYRFTINYGKMPSAVEALMKRVATIKATGDTAAARALVEPYVSGLSKSVHMNEIRERLENFPRATMIYSVKL
jgi:hypothetical protein